jgi:hypothetical protein
MHVVTASINNVRTRVVAQKYVWVFEEDRYILCIRKSEFVFIYFDTDIDIFCEIYTLPLPGT